MWPNSLVNTKRIMWPRHSELSHLNITDLEIQGYIIFLFDIYIYIFFLIQKKGDTYSRLQQRM